jgi:hypothetical protein
MQPRLGPFSHSGKPQQWLDGSLIPPQRNSIADVQMQSLDGEVKVRSIVRPWGHQAMSYFKSISYSFSPLLTVKSDRPGFWGGVGL